MERYRLDAAPRTLLGKQQVKRLKREGFYPAVIYGRGIEPTPLQVSRDVFDQMLKKAGHNVLIDLFVEGADGVQTVMVKKLMRSAITLQIMNVDFHRVSVTDTINSRVPLELVGEPHGVTTEGGTLIQAVSDIEIRGVAANLPPSVQADVSHLGVGDTLHVRDITLPEGIEVLAQPEDVIAVVHASRVAEEEPVEAEAITEPDLTIKAKEE